MTREHDASAIARDSGIASEPPVLARYQRIKLSGMSREVLNGAYGVVMGYDATTGRYEVHLECTFGDGDVDIYEREV